MVKGANMLDPSSGLTDMQVLFCRAYVVEFSVGAAERAAGLHDGYGSDLLKMDKIQTYIRKLTSSATKRAKVDAVRVLERAWEIGNSDITDVFDHDPRDLRKLPKRIRRAIKKIKFTEILNDDGQVVGRKGEIEMHPKMPALQLLAVATGAVTQRDLGNSDVFEGFTVIMPGDMAQLPKPEGNK
jgi:phage terminase small subunit